MGLAFARQSFFVSIIELHACFLFCCNVHLHGYIFACVFTFYIACNASQLRGLALCGCSRANAGLLGPAVHAALDLYYCACLICISYLCALLFCRRCVIQSQHVGVAPALDFILEHSSDDWAGIRPRICTMLYVLPFFIR